MSKQENYLGFMQILAELPLHQHVFGICRPRYKVERGKVYVLYSAEAEDDFLADEIIDYLKQKYNSMEHMALTSALERRDIGFRYTAIDVNDGSSSDMAVQKALRILGDLWDEHAERTLWRIQDVAPEAQEGLFAAVSALGEPNVSYAVAAQVAVSLRRALEEVTRQFVPDDKDLEKPGWVNNRWENYKKNTNRKDHPQEYLLASEALDLDGTIERLMAQVNINNRSIHKNLSPKVFENVVLRMVLLLNDLTEMGFGEEGVQIEPEFLRSLFLNLRPSDGE